ncbi:MAG: hypothetical protein AUJ12_01345 [Alphaproteobacteria bacterium CG1_02_46_17]|nr:MAG: hypothetical protein AUJ12_01345 [Alphaproteobacteria bacterium CG1_02_46_17]
MVKGLSNKIVFFILFLLFVGGAGGYLVYEYLMPAREGAERELSATKAAIDAKYQEVAKMKEEFILLQSQLRDFKNLEARGFFGDQDRAQATENFSKLVDRTGLLQANLKYEAGKVVVNKMAEDAKQIVIKSRGQINIESLDDVDVYTLLKYMQERYPGSVDVTKVTLERTETLNADMLRQIGGGTPVPLVKGVIEFDWRTMTSRDVTAPQGGGI